MSPVMKSILEESDWTSDPWSACMGWLFAIADYLTFEAIGGVVPAEWEYRPSAGGPERDAPEFIALMDTMPRTESVLHAGKVLFRYRAILDRKGLSY